jgi:hypothetical protein
VLHQTTAYEAFFQSFWTPQWDWFNGVIFWDIDANLVRKGMNDPGFTPLAKPATESVIQKYFIGN